MREGCNAVIEGRRLILVVADHAGGTAFVVFQILATSVRTFAVQVHTMACFLIQTTHNQIHLAPPLHATICLILNDNVSTLKWTIVRQDVHNG